MFCVCFYVCEYDPLNRRSPLQPFSIQLRSWMVWWGVRETLHILEIEPVFNSHSSLFILWSEGKCTALQHTYTNFEYSSTEVQFVLLYINIQCTNNTISKSTVLNLLNMCTVQTVLVLYNNQCCSRVQRTICTA